ncbi:hypothetical protein [Magnetospira sp. QH-2]|uniref:hypothetical protein n=1 Tax=Magnetospira sp. (strain QH-2) TaxID=1288970 RepID=UPI0011DE4967|nr:hypothetical protein [Magnetospira sp. QH-2]
MIEYLSDDERMSITQWIVEQNLIGAEALVTSTTLKEVRGRSLPHPNDRAEWLLGYLVRISQHIGQNLSFLPLLDVQQDGGGNLHSISMTTYSDSANYLLAWSASAQHEELQFLLKFLERRGYLELGSNGPIPDIVVQPEGFAHVAERSSRPSVSHEAFVAMWFDPSMDEVYELGFEKAIRESGYDPIRIDRKEHINKIDDEIIADIRRSRFLVADFTARVLELDDGQIYEARGGVYFEAGFAHGLDIPIIWTCRHDMTDHLHFDIRQFNHIVWSDAEDLCTKLTNRIGTVIGDGPLKAD